MTHYLANQMCFNLTDKYVIFQTTYTEQFNFTLETILPLPLIYNHQKLTRNVPSKNMTALTCLNSLHNNKHVPDRVYK